ncbi:hypothetical protein OUZ56_029399 [Daphnia magna]|uniref:Chromo domain-containing protein n=1 Tax=Daphnia magna TaxID=35525 RepID=A0ABR0B6P1_9CRUS|nr:hypothetical protein OUZ56_029399 [Daphnia magna]
MPRYIQNVEENTDSDEYADFEVDLVLGRRYPNGRQSVQYLLHYVGYEEPEWTDWANCGNCRSLILSYLRDRRRQETNVEAGPAGEANPAGHAEPAMEVEPVGDAELDGQALLYCEVLLADEADPPGKADMAGKAEPAGEAEAAGEAVLAETPQKVPPQSITPLPPPSIPVPSGGSSTMKIIWKKRKTTAARTLPRATQTTKRAKPYSRPAPEPQDAVPLLSQEEKKLLEELTNTRTTQATVIAAAQASAQEAERKAKNILEASLIRKEREKLRLREEALAAATKKAVVQTPAEPPQGTSKQRPTLLEKINQEIRAQTIPKPLRIFVSTIKPEKKRNDLRLRPNA